MTNTLRIFIEAPIEDKKRFQAMSKEERLKQWDMNSTLWSLIEQAFKGFHLKNDRYTWEEFRVYCSERLGVELPSQERTEAIVEQLDLERLLMGFTFKDDGKRCHRMRLGCRFRHLFGLYEQEAK